MTDANLLLGRIDPTLGGKFRLDEDAAEAAIRTVAEPLGLSVLDCAEGITQIVSENMASAIKMVSTDRGRDPRDHTLVAFGGAGGLHAYHIARAVGINSVLVPPFAGVASAFGATTMDVRHDLERTFYARIDEVDIAALNAAFEALEDEARELLRDDAVSSGDIRLERAGGLRYEGQSYDVTTPVPGGNLDEAAVAGLAAAFNEAHEREYGVASTEFPVAIVSLRVTGTGRTAKAGTFDVASALGSHRNGNGKGSIKERRQVYFAGEHHDVDVHDAAHLGPNQQITGPAIIEQRDGVIVVPPGAIARTDKYDNVTITPEEQPA